MSQALHAKSGDNHLSAISDLNVIILPDGDQYFAQAVEVDYFACGSSVKNVQRNFVTGLASTIRAHLEKSDTIKKFLVPSPEDEIRELEEKAGCDLYSLDWAEEDLSETLTRTELFYFPFHTIHYKQANSAQAA